MHETAGGHHLSCLAGAEADGARIMEHAGPDLAVARFWTIREAIA